MNYACDGCAVHYLRHSPYGLPYPRAPLMRGTVLCFSAGRGLPRILRSSRPFTDVAPYVCSIHLLLPVCLLPSTH